MEDDYYHILGINRNASKDEIKKAYKEIARHSHPDKGGNADTFKKINEAYSVLSNDELKQRYDQFGKNGVEGGAPMPANFPGFFNMFPFQMRPQQNKRTPDRTLDLEMTMEEAYHGVSIKFRYNHKVFIGNASSATCHECKGSGNVIEQMHGPIGIIQNVRICHSCAGIGISVSEDQFRTDTEIIDISIPPHSFAGQKFTLKGRSDEMPKMETGDLVLTIVIKKHSSFELENGKDIIWKISVHPFEALTSFSRKIKLPSNETICIKHTPNDGFFSGLKKRKVFQNKGLFDMHGNRGSLLIEFDIQDFYVPDLDKAPLYNSINMTAPDVDQSGTPLNSLPSVAISQPQQQPQQQQQQQHHHQQQQHHQQHHVQECRQS